MKKTRTDWISILEAAYQFRCDDPSWLGGLIHAVQPSFDHGLGIIGFIHDSSDPERPNVLALKASDPPPPPGWEEAHRRVTAGLSPEFVLRMRQSTFVTWSRFSRDLFADRKLHAEAGGPLGMRDFVGLCATDPTGHGCVINAPSRKIAEIPRREIPKWERVAAHICAAFRLRRDLRGSGKRPVDPLLGAEAILERNGALAHAEKEASTKAAREALRDAVVTIDRAKSRAGRRDPEGGLLLWRGLVAGRWSVVDHFDRDGRRYFVARKNDPLARGPKVLSERERQVVGYARLGHSNKLIAYELGISSTSVATALSSACRKLGVPSRVALVQLAAKIER